MKYLVSVDGRELEVVLDAEGVHVDGVTLPVHLAAVHGTPLHLLTVGDDVHRVVARRGVERGRYTLSLGGFRYEVEALDERTRTIRQLSGASGAPGGPAPLVAPMPGLVVRVTVAVGDLVQAGQGLVVMEAMKMENELRASAPGTVTAVHVAPGAAVEKGSVLVELE